jgi:hypothetical protein
VQRAQGVIVNARNDESVPPSQRKINGDAGEKVLTKFIEDNIRLAHQAETKQKTTDDAYRDTLIKDMYSGQPQITEDVIANWPAPADGGPSNKEQMIRLLRAQELPGPLPRESHANSMELYKRIRMLPEGDPMRITNVKDIDDAMIAGRIDKGDHAWLEKTFNEPRTPGGEGFARIRNQFTTATTKAIDKSNPMMGVADPEASLRAYAFERMVDSEVEKYRAAGKDPSDLLLPGRPGYLGTPEIIQQYTQTLQQAQQAYVARLQRGMTPQPAPGSTIPSIVTPTQAAQQPLHNPGESPSDYMKRIAP